VFATLLGALPRPDRAATDDEVVLAAVRAQEASGLEPLTDGRLRDPDFNRLIEAIVGRTTTVDPVAWWSFANAATARMVKQALPGPYAIGWRLAPLDAVERDATTMRAAEVLREIVGDLAAAGCPLIEIEEAEAHRIGADEAERARFREAHATLLGGVDGVHLSLSITGGAAAAAGVETILAAPYASLAVDLIAGPDDWNLVTRAPRDRGIVVGALSARPAAEPKEVLLWGAHYAASSAGRGMDRVGLGSAGSWAALTWDEAVSRMRALGEAARLASMPRGEELASQLDPRAVSSRRAALGHAAARRPRGPRR
jgi:methionine synthase II (cobalamin-independent)